MALRGRGGRATPMLWHETEGADSDIDGGILTNGLTSGDGLGQDFVEPGDVVGLLIVGG